MASHFTKMVPLNRSEDDKRKHEEKLRDLMDKPDGLDYPPGCCINLTDEVLDKLGIDEMPEKDDTIHMCVIGQVTSVGDGAMGKCINLQITNIAIEDEDDENEEMEDRAERRYGKEDDEEDED